MYSAWTPSRPGAACPASQRSAHTAQLADYCMSGRCSSSRHNSVTVVTFSAKRQYGLPVHCRSCTEWYKGTQVSPARCSCTTYCTLSVASPGAILVPFILHYLPPSLEIRGCTPYAIYEGTPSSLGLNNVEIYLRHSSVVLPPNGSKSIRTSSAPLLNPPLLRALINFPSHATKAIRPCRSIGIPSCSSAVPQSNLALAVGLS